MNLDMQKLQEWLKHSKDANELHVSIPCPVVEQIIAVLLTLDRPEIDDFVKGVKLEAAHQLKRWGVGHDRSKDPEEWYWIVGHLAGKALAAQRADDDGKFMHHMISTAAVLANWHYFASNPDPAVWEPQLEPQVEPAENAELKKLKAIVESMERIAAQAHLTVEQEELEFGEVKNRIAKLRDKAREYRKEALELIASRASQT